MKLPAPLLVLAALLALAPAASAADTTVAADPSVQRVAALDGTLVWVTADGASQALMMRDDAGAPAHEVPGAPEARSYRSIDLGRDASGALVLTYLRCSTFTRCTPMRDDLDGHRATIRIATPAGCSVSTAPAIWRARMAYGLACRSDRRSGLYVKKAGAPAWRLPLPHDAVKYGSSHITFADLRGTRAAGVAADIYEYAFAESTAGTRMTSHLAAASEGDSDEHVRALALGAGDVLWSLTDSEHGGDPNEAIVRRTAGACDTWETLANDPGPDEESGYRATSLAVDGADLYLVVPATGIVKHAYAPNQPC